MTDHIDHLAALSGFRLEGDERERLRARLTALQSLIEGLPVAEEFSAPASRAPELPLRADQPGGGLSADQVLAGVPSREGYWVDCPPVREEPA